MLTGNKRRTHVEACVPKPQCRPVGQANSYSLMLMNIRSHGLVHPRKSHGAKVNYMDYSHVKNSFKMGMDEPCNGAKTIK